MVQREEMCLMLAARKVPAAIKWIEDRRENLMAAGKSRREQGVARMAFDDEGTILAAYIDYLQDTGAYPIPWPVGSGMVAALLFPGPYRIPKAGFSATFVFTNTCGRTAYRGPWQFESVAREVLLDIAARQIGLDPVELRRRNLLRNDDMPYANANGMPYDHVTPLETFEHALEILDYDAFRREQADARLRWALSRGRNQYVRRAHDERHGNLCHGRGDDPDRTVGQGQRVRGGRLGRKQHRDHGRPDDGRRPRRRHRRRRHRSRATPR